MCIVLANCYDPTWWCARVSVFVQFGKHRNASASLRIKLWMRRKHSFKFYSKEMRREVCKRAVPAYHPVCTYTSPFTPQNWSFIFGGYFQMARVLCAGVPINLILSAFRCRWPRAFNSNVHFIPCINELLPKNHFNSARLAILVKFTHESTKHKHKQAFPIVFMSGVPKIHRRFCGQIFSRFYFDH